MIQASGIPEIPGPEGLPALVIHLDSARYCTGAEECVLKTESGEEIVIRYQGQDSKHPRRARLLIFARRETRIIRRPAGSKEWAEPKGKTP